MMDAPVDRTITISLPISITAIPIERRRKMWNSRPETIEGIQEKLKEAGWNSRCVPRGPLSIQIRAASPPPPAGLSKRGAAALGRGETVWRSGRPATGALGDILMEAMGISTMQVTYLAVEKVYGREPRTDITIEVLS
jgi:hypothetical protein